MNPNRKLYPSNSSNSAPIFEILAHFVTVTFATHPSDGWKLVTLTADAQQSGNGSSIMSSTSTKKLSSC